MLFRKKKRRGWLFHEQNMNGKGGHRFLIIVLIVGAAVHFLFQKTFSIAVHLRLVAVNAKHSGNVCMIHIELTLHIQQRKRLKDDYNRHYTGYYCLTPFHETQMYAMKSFGQ